MREGIISRWENDHHVPTLGYLIAIAKHLDVTVDYLVKGK